MPLPDPITNPLSAHHTVLPAWREILLNPLVEFLPGEAGVESLLDLVEGWR